MISSIRQSLFRPLLRATMPTTTLLPQLTLTTCLNIYFPVLQTARRHLSRTQLPPRPKPPPDSEIEESFLKGSGPGGQKINKTNSAVQLRHVPTGIVVKSQATRSRSQNRKIARDLLAQKLDELYNGSQSRTAIVGDHKKKKAASKAKKSARKYRKLEEEKTAAVAALAGAEGHEASTAVFEQIEEEDDIEEDEDDEDDDDEVEGGEVYILQRKQSSKLDTSQTVVDHDAGQRIRTS